MRDLFRGKLVRITFEEPDLRAKMDAQWQRDTEFHRLSDTEPAMLVSEKFLKESFEKQAEKGAEPNRYSFAVRTLAEDKFIGFFGMWVDLVHADGWVGIGIGERDFWSKGYGTDMMQLCLQYAFTELSLYRVSLGLHAYNPRAMKSYEKAGFRLEGRTRSDTLRDGKYTDGLWMGILREEWEALYKGEDQ